MVGTERTTRMNLFDRLEKFIEREPNSGCWLWTGTCTPNGYGGTTAYGRKRRAHRLIWFESGNSTPDGMQLDHLCRVRCCVNPAHLELVTPRTNTLRGIGIAALRAKITHCRKGHPYAGENLVIRPNRSRRCRICDHASRTAFSAMRSEQRRIRREGLPK